MTSLRTRLLLAASVVLALFVALCGASLERAFRQAALESQYDRMQGLVYALVGATVPNAAGDLGLSDGDLPDPRLRQPQSGLEAALIDERGAVAWKSPGFGARPLPAMPEVGRFVFEYSESPDYFMIVFGIRWIDAADAPRRYGVVLYEDSTAFYTQLGSFRETLWLALGISTMLLLAALTTVLAWGLRPVRRLTHQLRHIEESGQAQIEGRYPKELAPLAEALNAMLTAERNQQTRYRNALGDLAHSLKTPLAVLRGQTDDAALPANIGAQINEQLLRMQHIVDYQLRRAAAAGSRTLSEPVALRPLADKILAALAKIYPDLKSHNDISADIRLRADQGDLYEVLGNLLDNAAKYGRGEIRAAALRTNQKLLLTVEDNGPGFPEPSDALLIRGVRADSRTAGQGIGLSTVAEIVKAYEGSIELGRSEKLGGACVALRL